MTRLKTEMLVAAAIRTASAELVDCVVIRRGNAEAGAILIHMDALDGRHMLLARALDFDGAYSWRAVLAGESGDGWTDREAVETRLAREMDIDPDAWILGVQDARGRNPFDLL
ncbi:MAG: DUF1491 family protein [Candidatus Puniceispirillaceae bacterium]